jgi:hypothetical protein
VYRICIQFKKNFISILHPFQRSPGNALIAVSKPRARMRWINVQAENRHDTQWSLRIFDLLQTGPSRIGNIIPEDFNLFIGYDRQRKNLHLLLRVYRRLLDVAWVS